MQYIYWLFILFHDKTFLLKAFYTLFIYMITFDEQCISIIGHTTFRKLSASKIGVIKKHYKININTSCKRYEKYVIIIIDQWSKLFASLDAQPENQILDDLKYIGMYNTMKPKQFWIQIWWYQTFLVI